MDCETAGLHATHATHQPTIRDKWRTNGPRLCMRESGTGCHRAHRHKHSHHLSTDSSGQVAGKCPFAGRGCHRMPPPGDRRDPTAGRTNSTALRHTTQNLYNSSTDNSGQVADAMPFLKEGPS